MIKNVDDAFNLIMGGDEPDENSIKAYTFLRDLENKYNTLVNILKKRCEIKLDKSNGEYKISISWNNKMGSYGDSCYDVIEKDIMKKDLKVLLETLFEEKENK